MAGVVPKGHRYIWESINVLGEQRETTTHSSHCWKSEKGWRQTINKAHSSDASISSWQFFETCCSPQNHPRTFLQRCWYSTRQGIAPQLPYGISWGALRYSLSISGMITHGLLALPWRCKAHASHWVTHIFDQLQDYGPVYNFWTFLFERLNKVLKRYSTNNHSNGEIEVTFMRAFQKDVALHDMVCHIYTSNLILILLLACKSKCCIWHARIIDWGWAAVRSCQNYLGHWRWHTWDGSLSRSWNGSSHRRLYVIPMHVALDADLMGIY